MLPKDLQRPARDTIQLRLRVDCEATGRLLQHGGVFQIRELD